MLYYYMAFQNKTQAFLLEERLKAQQIACDVTYIPREIMTELCSLGLRFPEGGLPRAAAVIRASGIRGFRLYLETPTPIGNHYQQIVV